MFVTLKESEGESAMFVTVKESEGESAMFVTVRESEGECNVCHCQGIGRRVQCLSPSGDQKERVHCLSLSGNQKESAMFVIVRES